MAPEKSLREKQPCVLVFETQKTKKKFDVEEMKIDVNQQKVQLETLTEILWLFSPLLC